MMDRDMVIEQLQRRVAELERLVAELRAEVAKARPASYSVREKRT